MSKVHDAKAKVVVATDLLALTMLTPPGEWGADIVIGSAQRFGVPMGYGGPHAAFLACHEEYKRLMPGRIIGTVMRVCVWRGGVCFERGKVCFERNVCVCRGVSVELCVIEQLCTVGVYADTHTPPPAHPQV